MVVESVELSLQIVQVVEEVEHSLQLLEQGEHWKMKFLGSMKKPLLQKHYLSIIEALSAQEVH